MHKDQYFDETEEVDWHSFSRNDFNSPSARHEQTDIDSASVSEVTTEISLPNDQLTSIPASLKTLPQWLVWSWGTVGSGKLTKIPFQQNGRLAKTNDANTWMSYESCTKAVSRFSGLGFVFKAENGLVGIDLDHCFNPAGELEPWAQTIVQQFAATYIERSPSGDGLHIWCSGRLLRTCSSKWKSSTREIDQGIEIYDRARYFTVTGNVYSGTEICDGQSGIDWIFEKYFSVSKTEAATQSFKEKTTNPKLIAEALKYVDADDYQRWITVGLAIKNEGLPLAMWEAWSSKSKKYISGECEKKWNSFKVR